MAWQSILVAIERSLNRSHSNPQRMPVDPFFVLSLDLFCINTLDGHFHRVNPAFIATLGHPEPDLLATNILDLLHPEDRPAAAAAIAGLAHGNPIACRESRFRCADGSYKWLAWNSTPFPAVGLAYTVARDRTRRKQDEEALFQSEARCVCALESTTDAFFAVDPDWRLIRVNQQAERLWMRHRDDVLAAISGKYSPRPSAVSFTGCTNRSCARAHPLIWKNSIRPRTTGGSRSTPTHRPGGWLCTSAM